MSGSASPNLSALGFLTVEEHDEHGLFGGYLVLNTLGRPLEFHCTAPVKANRAQEILYGATLAPFMYGEQIGRTLLEKAKTPPVAVLTDAAPALAVREFIDPPVVWVQNDSECGLPKQNQSGIAKLHSFTWGEHRLAILESASADEAEFQKRLASCGLAGCENGLDLMEPFSRIREAIAEAQKAARSAA